MAAMLLMRKCCPTLCVPIRVRVGRPPGDHLDRQLAFMRCLVGEHGLADHIADGVDGGIGRLQLLIYLDKATGVHFHLRGVKAGDFGVWLASDGNQNAAKNPFFVFFLFLGLLQAVRTLVASPAPRLAGAGAAVGNVGSRGIARRFSEG